MTTETCTCPSGDGSLRWPCPVHPPETVADVLADMIEWRELLKNPFYVTQYKNRIQAAHAREVGELESKYNELLLSAGNKYPDKSRHETALRYIKQAEATDSPDAAMSPRVEGQ